MSDEPIQLPPCPECGGVLRLFSRLTLKKPGTYSLAGTTWKAPAYDALWLECQSCEFKEEGKFT